MFLVPLASVLLGAAFLGETLSLWLLAGAALVICGIYLVNRQSAGGPERSAKTKKGES